MLPGRARLAPRPDATASATAKTIGIFEVAFFAANAEGVASAAITFLLVCCRFSVRMVEGASDILAISPDPERPLYEPSKRRLTKAHTGCSNLHV